MQKILILGGGTAGTLCANRLRRALCVREVQITVVDKDDAHVYQPGLLFVPFGMSDVERLIRDREEQLHNGIAYRTAGVERVVMNQHQVMLSDGEAVDYDVLVVASGAELAMDETEGLGGDGWGEKVFTFYTPEGAAELAEAMQWLREGRLVVNVVDMPIKCPVAPLEFCFLADWFLREQGVREQVELSYVTTLDGALPMPVVAKALGGMLAARGIALVTEFNTAQVDGVGGRLISYDEREVAFDLAVVIPAQCGAGCIRRSEGLGDELGFIDVDPYTLQSRVDPAVFAVGDAAALPTVKVGSVAMWSGEVVVENVVHYLAGEELVAGYDGHTNCFIETGNGKAMMLDFNYETEPVGGHFPSQVGLGLLKESQLNHIGKLLFEPVYWHSLLAGRDIPGLGNTRPSSGKHLRR